ncbi:EthD family reductase [Edwardsiella piscicida]|uniref:EthD family reductase n=2 Tax=Edwardsiella piscicida TaxID=1263550 RepID=UPI00084C1A5D|nr:EthD family reductase [Edwardsiella piscicida]AOP42407.1 EthD family reductase [Edwardsiella piscicida]EKS7765370.1 EthD family reductase [Edwardsiella piscicida]EKS7812253.1 EthD family reductase [Edwardsiella piscicida]UCQ21994.1 EthD family reductase [Edwardsiella piscicida]UCQ32168.1 EthD family reductase [Edwardsiella piscicida]
MITSWELLMRSPPSTPETRPLAGQDPASAAPSYPTLRRLVRHRVIDTAQRGVDFPRCPVDANLFIEMACDDLFQLMQAYDDPVRQSLMGEIDPAQPPIRLITLKNNIIPTPAPLPPRLKRISFIQRRPEMSPERFRHEWWDIHGDYLRRFQGVRGYQQSLILGRSVAGRPCAYDEVAIDGIVELYFDDLAALEADFASEAGQRAQRHAHSFLQAVSTYLVEQERIIP